jgi:hypothetical protein
VLTSAYIFADWGYFTTIATIMDLCFCSDDSPTCSVFDFGRPSHDVGDSAVSDHLTSLLGLDDPTPLASNTCPSNEWDPSASEWPSNDVGVDAAPSINTVSLHCHRLPTDLMLPQLALVNASVCHAFHSLPAVLHLVSV